MSCTVKTYVNKDGVKTDYAVFGKGDKNFVIIPGLSIKPVTESAAEIEKAYEIFSEGYTVYLFDRPKPLGEGATVCDIAEKLYETLIGLNIENAYFFGASQGGMILQSILINHPEIAKKAVLASTASRTDSDMKDKIGDWVRLAKQNDTKNLHLKFFEDIYSEELMKSLGESVCSLIPECTEEEFDYFCALANTCKDFDVYDSLCKITCPVLVIGSAKDKIMAKERQTEIAEKLGGELFLYSSFGHAVYDEAPDFKQRIFEFFEK